MSLESFNNFCGQSRKHYLKNLCFSIRKGIKRRLILTLLIGYKVSFCGGLLSKRIRRLDFFSRIRPML